MILDLYHRAKLKLKPVNLYLIGARGGLTEGERERERVKER